MVFIFVKNFLLLNSTQCWHQKIFSDRQKVGQAIALRTSKRFDKGLGTVILFRTLPLKLETYCLATQRFISITVEFVKSKNGNESLQGRRRRIQLQSVLLGNRFHVIIASSFL